MSVLLINNINKIRTSTYYNKDDEAAAKMLEGLSIRQLTILARSAGLDLKHYQSKPMLINGIMIILTNGSSGHITREEEPNF